MGRETILDALRGTSEATRDYLREQACWGIADCMTIRDRCTAAGTPVPLIVTEGMDACVTVLSVLGELEGE